MPKDIRTAGCPNMTYMHLGQQRARPVQVWTVSGGWVDGWIEAYEGRDVWSRYVKYSVGIEPGGRTSRCA